MHSHRDGERKTAVIRLLDANPLQDIHNTKKINAVVVGGKRIPMTERQERLARIEAIASKNRGGRFIEALA